MSVKQPGNTLLSFAAGLGIFQGLVWAILAILGIVARFADLKIATTHSENLSYFLTVLVKDDVTDVPLKGVGLFAISIVYLIVSILWVILSLVLFVIARSPRQDYLGGAKIGWGAITLITCVYDLIVTGMLGANYQKYLDLYTNNHVLPVLYTLLACGTLFSLAARGYVLWIVNLVVAILVLRSGRSQTPRSNTETYDSSSIDAFDDSRNYQNHPNHGTYGWENEDPKNQDPRGRNFPGHTNQGYGWENEELRFDQRSPQSAIHQGYPPASGAGRDRVAGLGKEDPRGYPKNVLPPKPPNNYRYTSPNIPQPDYNSPAAQQLKPAMKRYPPPPPNPKFNRY